MPAFLTPKCVECGKTTLRFLKKGTERYLCPNAACDVLVMDSEAVARFRRTLEFIKREWPQKAAVEAADDGPHDEKDALWANG